MGSLKLPVTGRGFVVRVPTGMVQPHRPVPMPSVATQVANAARSARRVFAGIMTGRLGASSEEVQRRHAICRKNSCGQYRADQDRCGACGCWLRAKRWLSVEACPVGLW